MEVTSSKPQDSTASQSGHLEACRRIESETAKSESKPSSAVVLPKWVSIFLVLLPALAFIISLLSLTVAFKSLRYSMGFARGNEDHDVVARVLSVAALTKGFSSIVTNGEFYVDLAVINRGNQKEIIRDAFLCYSDTNSFDFGSYERTMPPANFQLDRGEKRVIRLLSPFSNLNTGKRLWVGVAVRAIAPNADDVEARWPVCQIDLAPDGNGAWSSYDKDKTPLVQLISNQRLPHQKIAPDGF